jgi:small subunit ribosomal protein S21
MIIIKKKEKESIDRMLKRYKAKAKRTKLKSQLTNRKHYTKPSEIKRAQKQKAMYIQSLRSNEEKES